MERTYATAGITTVREIWVLLSVLLVLGVSVVVLYGVRTHAYALTGLAAFWIICVAVGCIRTLGELEQLDPDATGTQLAFRLATTQPILGIMPVILLLLP